MYKCIVCGNQNKENEVERIKLVNVRTDLDAEYSYYKCNKCGCIQLLKIPENLGDYYDNNSYYSFATKNKHNSFIKNTIRRTLFGTILYRNLKRKWLIPTYNKIKAIAEISFDKNQSIMDVGCGSGDFINRLRGLGFTNLLGIDPYLSEEMSTDTGVLLKPLSIDQVEEKFDQIWMIHSFEHVTNPQETLKEAIKHLNHNGTLIMELPLCDSYEFEKYGKYWTGCDAPVHIVMYTKKGIELLCNSVGGKVINCYYFASSHFLKLSEMAKKGYPLSKVTSENTLKELGNAKIKELQVLMDEINNKKKSGMVTFVIKAQTD